MATALASVQDVSDDQNQFVVGYTDGTDGVITSMVSGVKPGNMVRTALIDGERRIVEILKEFGWSSLRKVGVLEKIYADTLIVRTENGLQPVPWDDSANVELGNTVELTDGNTFCRVIDSDPIEIAHKPDISIGDVVLDIDGDTDGREGEEDTDQQRNTDYTPEQDIEISFDDIGGLQAIKERIREAIFVPRQRSSEFDQLNLDMKRGLLFFGPPGTGKTMVAKAIANELESFFFSIGGPEIVSKYYGESERQIRDRFDAAKDKASEENTSAIVFIDEIDSIVPRRAGADETERRIVAQFLDVLDGLEDRGDVIVVGATNRIDAIDPAVRRPGRLDEEIEFTLPDRRERREILSVVLRDKPISENVDIVEISELCNGWSGADLNYLVERAGLIAADGRRSKIDNEDVLIALAKIDHQRKERRKRENQKESQ